MAKQLAASKSQNGDRGNEPGFQRIFREPGIEFCCGGKEAIERYPFVFEAEESTGGSVDALLGVAIEISLHCFARSVVLPKIGIRINTDREVSLSAGIRCLSRLSKGHRLHRVALPKYFQKFHRRPPPVEYCSATSSAGTRTARLDRTTTCLSFSGVLFHSISQVKCSRRRSRADPQPRSNAPSCIHLGSA